jgi:hypothetical protein
MSEPEPATEPKRNFPGRVNLDVALEDAGKAISEGDIVFFEPQTEFNPPERVLFASFAPKVFIGPACYRRDTTGDCAIMSNARGYEVPVRRVSYNLVEQ